ncbi:MAG TPA: hypothetical protein VHY37_03515 [Tepidisphaeraceae bacterium]|nr:hypothetical protein [Tepidisphaeraceae bacterium]
MRMVEITCPSGMLIGDGTKIVDTELGEDIGQCVYRVDIRMELDNVATGVLYVHPLKLKVRGQFRLIEEWPESLLNETILVAGKPYRLQPYSPPPPPVPVDHIRRSH